MTGSVAPILYPPASTRQLRPAMGPTLVEWAHEHLLSMLVSMEIAPGARIGIDAVARQLGISQTPIREALSRLEAEKLVHKMPNIGYRAANQMSRAEIDDLYALRMLVEPYAARRAAESMSDEALHALGEIEHETHEIKAEKGSAYARFASADAKLHRLIAVGGGNRFIAETIEGLHAHLHIFRFLYSTNAPEEAAEEHARLIEALTRHDGPGAEDAMRYHLERARARLEIALETQEASAVE